ncbi:hypothetical protein PsorP6_017269 [Peronosclerospora sorghi]|uniref:Uncharacterized protein n=1 Tax=Peronosclerospora sorghi TaxID=230839 RepID=A0ACC0WLX3_9STRA|nr:hypothetical protein PsorP6_017269 [Peronosclerospora sorghi]
MNAPNCAAVSAPHFSPPTAAVSLFCKPTRDPLSIPKKGLKTPFQRGHEAQFGLVVTERDEATSAVRAVTCQFCLKFGREAKPRAKRKRTSHAKSFTAPFSVDVYTRYH